MDEAQERMVKARLATRVRDLLEERGIQAKTIAEAAAMTRSHLSQINVGKMGDLKLSTLLRLAHAFGLSLSELVAGIDHDLVPARPKTRRGRAA